MLRANVELAERATMTGSLDKGQKPAIRQYNSILNRLQGTGTIPEGLFVPLEEDASFDDVGVCCTQLAAYLAGTVEEPVAEKGTGMPPGPISINIGDVGEGATVDLGELIREAMPSWIKEKIKHKEPEHEEEEKPEPDMNDLESKMAELGAQMQVLAERMHREELSPEEIRKLADQMRQLGQQQSELARQSATARIRKPLDEAKE